MIDSRPTEREIEMARDGFLIEAHLAYRARTNASLSETFRAIKAALDEVRTIGGGC